MFQLAKVEYKQLQANNKANAFKFDDVSSDVVKNLHTLLHSRHGPLWQGIANSGTD